MVEAPGAPNRENCLGRREPPVTYLRDSRAIVTRPISHERDGSCLVCLSTTFLYFIRTSLGTGAELVGGWKVGSLCLLIFSFSLSDVLFLLVGTVISWSILRLIGSC